VIVMLYRCLDSIYNRRRFDEFTTATTNYTLSVSQGSRGSQVGQWRRNPRWQPRLAKWVEFVRRSSMSDFFCDVMPGRGKLFLLVMLRVIGKAAG